MDRSALAASSAIEFIRFVMDKWERARDDDQFLLLAAWHEQGMPRMPEACVQWILNHGMKAETVRRTRQELKARGYYPKKLAKQELFEANGEEHGDQRGTEQSQGRVEGEADGGSGEHPHAEPSSVLPF